MTKQDRDELELLNDRLASVNDDYEVEPTFNACLNAHGMYETMRFVLRLSPRNHQLMDQIEANAFDSRSVPPDVLQAYSTYIHETVHWWQHVGSTSGLLFSLSYLAQAHSSMHELRDVLQTIGAKKPLRGYTDKVLLAEGHAAQGKLAEANVAVNNAVDVEFYKAYAYAPRENIRWMIEDNHFESIGHGYSIVYGQLVGMVADVIDPDFTVLPKIAAWDDEIRRLRNVRHEGFFWGSEVHLPATGLRAIFEGQARFIQLQFLSNTQKQPMTCERLREMGYFSGIYVEAFDWFLKLSEMEWPETMDDPAIGLFLLICDVAINPSRGFPIDIESFEDLIIDVDAGARFTRLCLAVREYPELRTAIRNYSREEYVEASETLTQATGYEHPLVGLQTVADWIEKAPGLAGLMEEHSSFEFNQMNLPIRVFLSHFVSFCRDKLDHPEFFCWPGAHMAGGRNKSGVKELWLRHLSLFSDRGDKEGVYPRRWPNRSDEAVKQTFNRFYGTMALYDLTRQWLLKSGPFVCDFRWISENYDQSHADAWGNDTFKQVYGVTLDDFEIVE